MNVFTGREKRLIPNDLRLVEQKLSIQLPDDLKEHYLQVNGGTPPDPIWFDTIGHAEPVEVQRFFPIKYCKAQSDNPEFTLEGIARREWGSQRVPRNYLPFGTDVLGNMLCVDRTSGSVCYFDLGKWQDDKSPQENWAAVSRDMARSFASFILNLKPPAKQATVPAPVNVPVPPAPHHNVFRHCERPMMEWDFAVAERDLQLVLPPAFRSHYLRYNGGVPDQTVWVDDAGRLEVAYFLPLLVPPGQREGSILTVTGCAREGWNAGTVPAGLLPFAVDGRGNFFCLNYRSGEVRYVIRKDVGATVNLAKMRVADMRCLADSLVQFVEGLGKNGVDADPAWYGFPPSRE